MPGLAISFQSPNYQQTGPGIMGFQSANQSMVRGLARHSTYDPLYACSDSASAFHQFRRLVEPHGKRAERIGTSDLDGLEAVGRVVVGGAALGQLAWVRRHGSQRRFSLCGLLHTTYGSAPERISRLLLDPLQPWDALICTSSAARAVVDNLLAGYAEYLESLWGARAEARLQLPVLPLGIDCDRFASTPERVRGGQLLRARCGVGADAVVVLYFGRMSWRDKANPWPLFRALEALAAAGRSVHLFMAGYFRSDRERRTLRAAASRWCPSLPVSWLDGGDDAIRDHVWHAADVFVSLADNIQETFGLTPIEAMAAGLPAVVTQWDGYAESVREGVDGFQIPTLTPSQPEGRELALDFLTGRCTPQAYLGGVAQVTAVDVRAATRALERLVCSPELRGRMGASAATRAREVYDWSVVVPRYQELWAELDHLRATAPEAAPTAGRAAPLHDDPFSTFAHYPTARLTADVRVVRQPDAADLVRRCLREPMLWDCLDSRLEQGWVDQALAAAGFEPTTVGDLVTRLPPEARPHAGKLVAWLAKVGAVRAVAGD